MKKLIVSAAAAVMLCACATPNTEVGNALFIQSNQPLLVTAGTGKKVGKACGTNILGLFISGDMSIEAAKKDGGITKVASVNKEIKGYAVYAQVCTVVTGM